MDAALGDDGDLRPDFERISSRLAAVAQRVRLRLEGHRESWPYDLSAGLPYMAWSSQKPPRIEEIAAVIRREIRATPGVLRIEDWTGTWSPNTRTLSFGATIIAEDGALGLEFVPIGAVDGNHFPALTLFPSAVPVGL